MTLSVSDFRPDFVDWLHRANSMIGQSGPYSSGRVHASVKASHSCPVPLGHLRESILDPEGKQLFGLA